MYAIETSNLTKSYGRARGIADVSLRVEEGQFFGFIGPNGAGKSTFIRTILGLIRPSGGSASVLGLDICRDKKAILRESGYLPSEANFHPGMKVGEVLEFSGRLRGRQTREMRLSLCERLGLDCNRRVDELSFGNRKKVAIVAAFQHRPRLLVLDEPTSGLDPLMQHEFFQILKELNASGTTIFLSSHILSEVQNNCSRAAIIREGHIVACESVETLGHSSSRRVVFRGRADISSLKGIVSPEMHGDLCSFLYTGPVQPLLAALAAGEVRDLEISEPSLEEIFMHYYK